MSHYRAIHFNLHMAISGNLGIFSAEYGNHGFYGVGLETQQDSQTIPGMVSTEQGLNKSKSPPTESVHSSLKPS